MWQDLGVVLVANLASFLIGEYSGLGAAIKGIAERIG